MTHFFVYRDGDGDGENYLEKFGTLDEALTFLGGRMSGQPTSHIRDFQLIQGEQMPIEIVRGTVRIVPDAAQADQLGAAVDQLRLKAEDLSAQFYSHDALLALIRDTAAAQVRMQAGRIDALEGTVAGQAAMIATLEARIATAGRSIEALQQFTIDRTKNR